MVVWEQHDSYIRVWLHTRCNYMHSRVGNGDTSSVPATMILEEIEIT